MPKVINLAGKTYGRLVVLDKFEIRKRNQAWWLCLCTCGNKKIIRSSSLKDGSTKSCGCLRKELTSKRRAGQPSPSRTHGMNRSPEYKCWLHIKDRCHNPKNKSYHNYGGRGIKVCDGWRYSFECFYADMGKRPSSKHTIERVDNNGDYTPENCKWATRLEQGSNTRKNRYLTLDGKTLHLKEWSRKTGLPHKTISDRIDRLGWSVKDALTKSQYEDAIIEYDNKALPPSEWSRITGIPPHIIHDRVHKLQWSIEKALTTPVEKQESRMLEYNGETKSLSEWAKEYGLKYMTLHARIYRHGYSIEKALTTPVKTR